MIVWLLACATSPYPEYWPDKSAYPVIKTVDPATLSGRTGGDVVTIEGNRLSNTTTVTVGGRNAEVVSVDEHAVQVRVPALPPGPRRLAVSLVTGRGAATQENALTIESDLEAFWSEEAASVSVLRYDCPVEAWGTYDNGEQYPFGWCGPDMGYASAEAWMGSGPQPGFSADMAGVAPLSELPPVGEVALWVATDPLHPTPPLVFNAHGTREAIAVQTERDFARDLAFAEERRELLEATYYWADSITEWTGPFATLYDEEQCWLDELTIEDGDGDMLTVDGDASGATSIDIGFGFVEDIGDDFYEDWAITASSGVRYEGGHLIGDASGPVMRYNLASGWFEAQDGFSAGDIPSAEYTVRMTDAKGTTRTVGTIEGPEAIDLWTMVPDVTLGDAVIPLSEDLVVEWTPVADTGMPVVVALELVVFDADIANPNGPTPVARLLIQADDSAGRLVVPATDLDGLPLAPNRWSSMDEQTGYWGELSLVRHQLRKTRFSGGDVVVDFIHAVNGPVTLVTE